MAVISGRLPGVVGEVDGAAEEDAVVIGVDVGGLGEVAGQGTNTKTRGKARQNTQNQRGGLSRFKQVLQMAVKERQIQRDSRDPEHG